MEEPLQINLPESRVERSSTFEILRIVSMLFIVLAHFSYHGGFDFSGMEQSPVLVINEAWLVFISSLGNVGVNAFVLISSFFLIGGRFKCRKILSLLLQMLFFSVVLNVVFFLAKPATFSFAALIKAFFPFGSSTWWFMTAYLLLYLFSALLRPGIKALNKRFHLILIIVLVVLWAVIPTLIGPDYRFTDFGWFLLLFLIGSYVRLYDLRLKMRPGVGIVLAFLVLICGALIKSALAVFLPPESALADRVLTVFSLVNINNIFQVGASILLFLSFKGLRARQNKGINFISATMVTVYLLHEFPQMRVFLWGDLFRNASYGTSPLLIPYSIGVAALVLVSGVFVGIAYRYSFGLIFNKFLKWLDRKVLFRVDEIANSVSKG